MHLSTGAPSPIGMRFIFIGRPPITAGRPRCKARERASAPPPARPARFPSPLSPPPAAVTPRVCSRGLAGIPVTAGRRDNARGGRGGVCATVHPPTRRVGVFSVGDEEGGRGATSIGCAGPASGCVLEGGASADSPCVSRGPQLIPSGGGGGLPRPSGTLGTATGRPCPWWGPRAVQPEVAAGARRATRRDGPHRAVVVTPS